MGVQPPQRAKFELDVSRLEQLGDRERWESDQQRRLDEWVARAKRDNAIYLDGIRWGLVFGVAVGLLAALLMS